jgi:hypothetical protein
MRTRTWRRLSSASLAFAALLALASCKREEKKATEVPQLPSAAGLSVVNRTLLYPGGDDMLLMVDTIPLPSYGDAQKDMAEVIRRYLEGPPGDGQFQPFPEHCALRALFLRGSSEVVVDLTGTVRSGGGSDTETARVYGLVDTIAWNFKEVRSVRLLVDGQEIDTLLGHLDLSHPLPPEARFLAPGLRRQVGVPGDG